MVIKHITQIEEPILHQKTSEVTDFADEEVQQTVTDLVDSMRFHNLVGMAAPQIARSIQVFVTEIRKTRFRNPRDLDPLRIYINPVITGKSRKLAEFYESCGSNRDIKLGMYFAPVKRPESLTLEAYDRYGKKFTLNAKGFLARVIQHECDHLEGHEFIDKITDKSRIIPEKEYLRKLMQDKKV